MPTAFAIIEAVQWVASTRRIGAGEGDDTLGDIRPEWWNTRGSCFIA